MKLLINGSSHELADRLTISQLLEQLKLYPDRVVLELNLKILTATENLDKELCDGDQLEIIQFVGGG
ncbi:sulfur carrier protein ThiS [Geopsychrobacter electrodiphilus]|uniref:sulfur carrier protein ThiS n=1 Tax=Geopsychrobacter electrodiphilus TaxID=225196 RepID=UPI0003734FC5|nr:sulfur carrier protein ThiS [Geopsychrobacter electrodiphilus]